MNVLSIDFDYFQKIKAKDFNRVLGEYPDPIDHSPEISQVVWGAKYAMPQVAEQIRKVALNRKEFENVLGWIPGHCKNYIPVMIAHSHRYIYDFIKEYWDGEKIRLVNLDFHHDAYTRRDEVDCGNWAYHLENDFGLDYHWIAPHAAMKNASLCRTLEEPIRYAQFNKFTQLHEDGLFKDIDLVFVCRSDAWLPPHLDIYFDEFVNRLRSYFQSVTIETSIQKPRDIQKYIVFIKEFASNG